MPDDAHKRTALCYISSRHPSPLSLAGVLAPALMPLLQHLLPRRLPPSLGAPHSFLWQTGKNTPSKNLPITLGRVLWKQVKFNLNVVAANSVMVVVGWGTLGRSFRE